MSPCCGRVATVSRPMGTFLSSCQGDILMEFRQTRIFCCLIAPDPYHLHGNGVCRPAWENRLTNSALMTPTNKRSQEFYARKYLVCRGHLDGAGVSRQPDFYSRWPFRVAAC